MPGELADPRPQPPGRLVGVHRQQAHLAGLEVGGIDAGVGADEAVPGLGDDQSAPAAHDPGRLHLGDRMPGIDVVGGDLPDPALGLRHDLVGDDEHVVVRQFNARCGGGRDDEGAEVRSRRHLRDPDDGQQDDRAGGPGIGGGCGLPAVEGVAHSPERSPERSP